jgi:hypothetical protein
MAQTIRTFRIFISSTFSDLKDERNALQRYVFPRLRDLCTQHGCRFQAIDLRWGVRDEASLDQQTMRVCLDEIHRSQKTSPRPNFIVLLGDRYGWRPLPAEIPEDEFEAINGRVSDPADRTLLAKWYKRDDNAQYNHDEHKKPQAIYCLQPRQDRFVDYDVWEREVERPLRGIMLSAVAGLTLPHEDKLKYMASATEQEIAAGVSHIPDAREHVYCFFRTIIELPLNQSTKDFTDLDDDNNTDAEAAMRLSELKERLTLQLPENIHHYEAHWTGSSVSDSHIGTLPEKLEECLALLEDVKTPQTLCIDLWKQLARVIQKEVARIEKIDPLGKEIADHTAFGLDRARSFIGRTETLQRILAYIDSTDRHPLVVFGESGSGKSALMAKAIQQSRAQSKKDLIVFRFIGATPDSSNGRTLLENVCRQISRHYGADETESPTDYMELVRFFTDRLALATSGKPLILFLDALEQLADADRARSLSWMPRKLPANVHLIVSTLPGECLELLQRKMNLANFIKLTPMSEADGQSLLKVWLGEAARTLQAPQMDEVMAKFRENGLPLYLKLAFEEARRWRSYSPAVHLDSDIQGIIRQLFARLSLDANHGPLVVSRSLSYLAAAKYGLSEDELLDVLSHDQDVLLDFKSRAKHTPPDERLPVIVWSRFYFDLEPYLMELSSEGAFLFGFYHRQIREVVEDVFLSGDERRMRHATLANYFSEQDLFDPQKRTPNVRKLSELAYQQTFGQQLERLYTTLTDFEFLEAKCRYIAVATSGTGDQAKTVYGGVYELLDDFQRALDHFPSTDTG